MCAAGNLQLRSKGPVHAPGLARAVDGAWDSPQQPPPYIDGFMVLILASTLEYRLPEGHPWIWLRVGTRSLCCHSLGGEYRQTPRAIRISDHSEGAFPSRLFI